MFAIFVTKCPYNSKNVCVIFVHVLRLSNICSLSYVALTLSKFGHPWYTMNYLGRRPNQYLSPYIKYSILRNWA
jgi:hypothetical protein